MSLKNTTNMSFWINKLKITDPKLSDEDEQSSTTSLSCS